MFVVPGPLGETVVGELPPASGEDHPLQRTQSRLRTQAEVTPVHPCSPHLRVRERPIASTAGTSIPDRDYTMAHSPLLTDKQAGRSQPDLSRRGLIAPCRDACTQLYSANLAKRQPRLNWTGPPLGWFHSPYSWNGSKHRVGSGNRFIVSRNRA